VKFVLAYSFALKVCPNGTVKLGRGLDNHYDVPPHFGVVGQDVDIVHAIERLPTERRLGREVPHLVIAAATMVVFLELSGLLQCIGNYHMNGRSVP
jgi:hypothetical protein